MYFKDYLERKSDECGQNEILSYLTIVLGAVFLVGGLLVTVIVTESPNWFLLLPYELRSYRSSLLGLILTVLGFALISAGFILSVFYDRKRVWYLGQLKKSSMFEEEKEKLARKKRAST